MDRNILARSDVRFSGVVVLIAATLAALLVAFVAAKPSQAEPLLKVNPTEVGFGAVEVGTGEQLRTITITNNGDTDAVIGAIQLGGADAGQFTLPGLSIPGTGLTLAPGESTTVDVGFSPTGAITDPQRFLSELRITSLTNDVLRTVNVEGIATPNPPNTQPGAQPDCDITGTNQGEVLTGTPAADVICGLGGADRINGLGSNDVMRGGSGNDRIMDKAGTDKLLGQGGRDRLNAKDRVGGDLLKGGGGKDRAVKDKKDKARGI
jgi:Ca2+-binding RTX toxin-like protein